MEEIRLGLSKTDFKIIFEDKGEIDLIYYLNSVKDVNLFIRGKRITKLENVLSSKIDIDKTYTAAVANFIQALDASLVR